MHDYRPCALFDDIGQNAKGRRRAPVAAATEHIDVRALGPVDVNGCVDRLLDVLAVKVQWRELGIREGTAARRNRLALS